MIADLREVVALIESGWRQVPVLVVGDVMLDRYIWGEVERISPEAPVPVVRTSVQDEKPGGAANVAMNLAGLGACVSVCGFAGGDPEQEQLESLLADAGVEPLLTPVPGAPTTTKLRILSGNQQMMRLDTEPPPSSYPAAAYDDLLQRALAALPNAAVVVLSDYAKGVLTEQVCRELISQARELQHSGAGRSQAPQLRALSRRNRHLPQPERTGSGHRRAVGGFGPLCSPPVRQCLRPCKWNSWPSRWARRELRCCARTRACMFRLSCGRCTTSPARATR